MSDSLPSPRVRASVYKSSASEREADSGRYSRAFEDMYYLIDKHAPFPDGEGPAHLSDDERAELPDERDHTKN